MKTFILLTFAVMFLGFYEFTGGSDFEPLSESPFAEGREVDMTPMKPVTVATKNAPAEVNILPASVEVSGEETTTAGSQAELVEAAKAQLRNVIESTEKAKVLTAATEEGTAQAALASLSEIPQLAEEKTEADGSDIEVSRLAVQPANPVLPTVADEPAEDVRLVAGSRVNMRMGPGTNFDVLTKLVRGDEVVVLRVNEDGWAQLRGPNGRVGWMAARLLTAKAE